MGFVEAKLVLNNDELPPSPSSNSLDVVLADLARLEVVEKPGHGADAPGMAVAQAYTGADPDLGSPKKGMEEAEKEVPMQFPQRPEAPDCAFYKKTGACKFGSACKFNHPPKRRKPGVRAKKGAEHVQAAREEHKSNGTKMMAQGAHRLPKNAVGKQKECLFKKDDKVEKQTSSIRLQQEDCKFQKNAIGKQIPPFKKFEQTEKKAHQMERHWLRSEQDDSKLQKNAIRKRIPPFKKFEQTERKTDEVEKQCSMLEQEDSKADEVEKQNSRSEQEDSKADEVEKHSSRWEQEDSKATEKMSKEAISGNVGLPECKFYKTSGRCKYGKSCKYTHSLKKIEAAPIALNFLGLPIRPGEKECPCYMHTGNCKYAANCKYHHPEPTVAILEQGALPVCQIGGSEQQIPFGASPLPVTPSPTQGAFYVPTPSTVASPAYFSESHLHPPGLLFPSNSECNGYQHIHPDKHPKRHGKSRPSVHQKRGAQI
ncbi:uncharacterized protein LOC141814366 isoform X2 [Curcuma longa]|uniref:uncharacterized protein LOC141814366 isoform X2 n=1 Tax=Curcuma longa TaxID=136217 RepID=UPI003D9F2E0F